MEHTLAGDPRSLTQRHIAEDVLERPSTFDPERDASVRIEISKLRQALDLYYAGAGRSDRVVIRIPLGSYVPRFSCRDTPQRPETDRREEPPHAGIAVLPFETRAGSEDADWLAFGLGEEVALILARIPELAVASRHAIRPYLEPHHDLKEIERDLGVRFFLDGSIQQVGERVRVHARLYDVKRQRKTWSGRFERNLRTADLLDLLDDIAHEVVAHSADVFSGALGRSLRGELGASGLGAQPDSDIHVYEAILRFHQYLHCLDQDTYAAARLALEQAITIAPDYPLVMSILGDIRRAGDSFGFSEDPGDMQTVRELQERALSLAPDCLPCRMSLGYTLLKQRELRRLRELVEQIIDEPTNPVSYKADAAVLLAFSGDWERGCGCLRAQLQTLDGCPGYFLYPLVLDAYRRGELDQALELLARIRPTALFWHPLLEAVCLWRLGRLEDACGALERLLAIRPDFSERGRYYVSCVLAEDALVDALLADFTEVWKAARQAPRIRRRSQPVRTG